MGKEMASALIGAMENTIKCPTRMMYRMVCLFEIENKMGKHMYQNIKMVSLKGCLHLIVKMMDSIGARVQKMFTTAFVLTKKIVYISMKLGSISNNSTRKRPRISLKANLMWHSSSRTKRRALRGSMMHSKGDRSTLDRKRGRNSCRKKKSLERKSRSTDWKTRLRILQSMFNEESFNS